MAIPYRSVHGRGGVLNDNLNGISVPRSPGTVTLVTAQVSFGCAALIPTNHTHKPSFAAGFSVALPNTDGSFGATQLPLAPSPSVGSRALGAELS